MRIGAGRWKGRTLPRAFEARPVPGRLKTSLFSVLAPVLEGARVLDVFAGVGGMGLEALSRGAAHVTLVDKDPRAVSALEEWLDTAGARREGAAVRRDATRGAWPAGPFDLVFVDPPFALWGEQGREDLLRFAMEVLATGGLVVLRIHGKAQVPVDARWRETRRTSVGSTAYVFLRHPSQAAPSDPPK